MSSSGKVIRIESSEMTFTDFTTNEQKRIGSTWLHQTRYHKFDILDFPAFQFSPVVFHNNWQVTCTNCL